MSNALYDLARQKFLDGDIDWSLDNIKAVLVDTALYTVNLATHAALDDIPAGAREATSANLTGKTSTAGVADAADVVYTAVPVGPSIEAVVLYVDSGVESTSWVIAYIDTATNLPVTPNGGDITIQWDSGANKIFKL